MAITGNTLSKSLNTVSNFLIREQWRDRNFCRTDGIVTLDTTGDAFEVGEIVVQVAGSGDFVELTSANHATADNVFGIIVDERIQDPVFYNGEGLVGDTANQPTQGHVQISDWTTGDVVLALLVSGDAIVRKDGMTFGTMTDEGEIDVVVEALEAAGIKVQDSLKGKYSTDVQHPFRNGSNVAL